MAKTKWHFYRKPGTWTKKAHHPYEISTYTQKSLTNKIIIQKLFVRFCCESIYRAVYINQLEWFDAMEWLEFYYKSATSGLWIRPPPSKVRSVCIAWHTNKCVCTSKYRVESVDSSEKKNRSSDRFRDRVKKSNDKQKSKKNRKVALSMWKHILHWVELSEELKLYSKPQSKIKSVNEEAELRNNNKKTQAEKAQIKR